MSDRVSEMDGTAVTTKRNGKQVSVETKWHATEDVLKLCFLCGRTHGNNTTAEIEACTLEIATSPHSLGYIFAVKFRRKGSDDRVYKNRFCNLLT